MRLLTVVALSASITGCAAQATAARPQATGLLIGANNSIARVLIKSVDNGPTLWALPGALGNKVTITPGLHKVEVMCEFQGSLHFAPGGLTIDVQPGRTYDLVASAAPGADRCNVLASVRS